MLLDILSKKEKKSFYNRHEIIRPLKEAEINFSEVKKLGFNVSRDFFKYKIKWLNKFSCEATYTGMFYCVL
ncbi:hypothetical protein BpHYR1_038481 [Brachionus plicatilis]|uniref:Uncharacterized protein n=1 Tax=Brachionus plicatilis TaxID=10195 RepID=A0A3M7R1X5_BRAPC|nr:hypothetical protein BpHYR1_038481 [Brachionus plicatilis]